MKHKNITKMVLLLLLGLLLGGCAKTKSPPADTSAAETAPPEADYSYTLTPEQVQNFQSATSYLLKREGEDLYMVQYNNCGATLSDGKLRTNYDGMAIEVSDRSGERFYPVLDLNCTNGTVGYIGAVVLTDKGGNGLGWRCLLQIDSNQAKPSIVAMRPHNVGANDDLLAGKFRDLPDFSTYSTATFLCDTYYIPRYKADGTPLTIGSWHETTRIGYYTFFFAQNPQLTYVPLVGGDYYLLYEITDTKGDTYCSPLIPYPTEPAPDTAEIKPEPDITVKWEKGKREQFLFERDDIAFYLSVEKDSLGNSVYCLKAKNNRQNTISFDISDEFVNDVIPFFSGFCVKVEPGKFVGADPGMFGGLSFGLADSSPDLETIKTLQFSVSVQDGAALSSYTLDSDPETRLFEDYTVLVDMTDAWPITRQHTDYFSLTVPAMDALAKEQLLLENEFIRLTLIGAGCSDKTKADTLYYTFRCENLSSREQRVEIIGLSVNGIFQSTIASWSLPAGCIGYESDYLWDFSIEDSIGTSIASLSVLVETYGQEDWAWPSSQLQWIPITLESSGTAAPFTPGITLWEKDGIKLLNQGYDPVDACWILVLQNDSDQHVRLELVDPLTGDEIFGGVSSVPTTTKSFFTVKVPSDAPISPDGIYSRTIGFDIYTFDGNKLLYEGPRNIQLSSN